MPQARAVLFGMLLVLMPFVADASEQSCHEAPLEDVAFLRLRRPVADSDSKPFSHPVIGMDRQRFSGGRVENESVLHGNLPDNFAGNWYQQLKDPPSCPMILCHGACADIESACKLPSAEAGIFETLTGRGCEMHHSLQK